MCGFQALPVRRVFPFYEGREQAGHREADTVVSRQSAVCVAVLVERKPRFYLVIRQKRPFHEAGTVTTGKNDYFHDDKSDYIFSFDVLIFYV